MLWLQIFVLTIMDALLPLMQEIRLFVNFVT
jgi:hypothetical protein